VGCLELAEQRVWLGREPGVVVGERCLAEEVMPLAILVYEITKLKMQFRRNGGGCCADSRVICLYQAANEGSNQHESLGKKVLHIRVERKTCVICLEFRGFVENNRR